MTSNENSGCSFRLALAGPGPCPHQGYPSSTPGRAAPLPTILSQQSCQSQLASPKPDRRTLAASPPSTAPKYFFHLSGSQTRKQPGQHFPVLLSHTEGNSNSRSLLPWQCPPLLQEKQLARATSHCLGTLCPPAGLPQALPPLRVAKSLLQLAGKKSIAHKSNLNTAAFSPLKPQRGSWVNGGINVQREMCPYEVSPLLWTSSQPLIIHNILHTP